MQSRLVAQDRNDTGRAMNQTEEIAERLGAELRCLTSKVEQLGQTRRLMQEALAQMSSRLATEADRRAAVDAIESLRQRAVRIDRETLACRQPASAEARSATPPEGVVYVEPPRDPVLERVAQSNPATRVIEEDVVLGPHVRIVVGEQVDGQGRLEDGALRVAVHGIGGQLDRCYERMVDRGAFVRGRIILSFTVTPSGTIANVATESSTFHDRNFAECVRRAGQGIRRTAPALGGNATFSYTLALPGQ